MEEKPLVFCGSSRKDLKSFPEDARSEAGYQLYALQCEGEPSDFKYMRSVGTGVFEIRIHAEDGQYRVFYIAKFAEAVYVLHCFQKKENKTPQREIDVAKKRYEALVRERQEKGLA